MNEQWTRINDHHETKLDPDGDCITVWRGPIADMKPFTEWVAKSFKGKIKNDDGAIVDIGITHRVQRVEMIGQDARYEYAPGEAFFLVHYVKVA